ncbi:MAG: hypothetical protein JWQ81_6135 [Amycolatopsis sp.]|uniref:hypothetical protein n=1 Tax=Amycolatopsis sp. TaxID=37632 RepID=UPI0026165A87|nr:hypothetical protein [Amycolatopsis sp.]MCU1685396.1 hypothetical protein [Amycolatopsis sp.]
MTDDHVEPTEFINRQTGSEVDLTKNRGYTANPLDEIQTIAAPPEDFWTPIDTLAPSATDGENEAGQE